jgi:enoyl-CoA hydratase/carnithine racemase
VTRDGPIATITISRPEVRNCLDLAMWQALRQTMEALDAEHGLRCVVIRGAGDQAFSAGADIAKFEQERGTRAREDRYAVILSDGFQSIRRCRHPVVAMIMGHCIGGGCGIATMCDFRVGGEGIRMGITALRLGIWYPYAEIDPVLQMVGTGVANELLIEGRIFDGRTAYEKGLLSRVVPDDRVEAEALALAGRICQGAPLSARFHKRAIQALRGELPITPQQTQDVNAFVETEDHRNAVAAFLAKRAPEWRGR